MLKVISGLLGGGAACTVGIPAVRALLAPIGKVTVTGTGQFVPVTLLDAVPADGAPLKVPVVAESPQDAWSRLPPTQIGAVYVRRVGDEVVAYSTVCPHLGCGVDYVPETETFACPCHESAFDVHGAIRGGPSPRALDQLETRVMEGRVEVRYQRFKQGTKEKVPV